LVKEKYFKKVLKNIEKIIEFTFKKSGSNYSEISSKDDINTLSQDKIDGSGKVVKVSEGWY